MTDYNRPLFATLIVGSHLFGGVTPKSDVDILKLYVPVLEDLVRNRQHTYQNQVGDGLDVRRMLLGDFVMGLGFNIENSLIALHYRDIFGVLEPYWLNRSFAQKISHVADDMWEHAKTPKSRAHAWRYKVAAWYLLAGNRDRCVYPLIGPDLEVYEAIRSDSFNEGGWEIANASIQLIIDNPEIPEFPIDTRELATWALEQTEVYDL